MRDISQLHPILRYRANQLVKKCSDNGIKIKITECLRTEVEQNELYSQGRTKPGSIVTNAKGSSYSSMHQWGVAFDFCRADGKGAYDNSDKLFQKVGEIGESIGLKWGGNFKSITDMPHFQLKLWGDTASQLKRDYVTPKTFFNTWSEVEEPTGYKAIWKGTFPVNKECYHKKSCGSGTVKIQKLKPLNKVICTGYYRKVNENYWLLCYYDGKLGWVNSSFITI